MIIHPNGVRRRLIRLSVAVILLPTGAALAQTSVTGVVSDAFTGARLEGVAVSDSATGASATSDKSGQFSIACHAPMTLVLSRAGYQSGQRRVTDCSSTIQVSLISGAQGLAAMNVVAELPPPALSESQGASTLSPLELKRGTGLWFQDAVNLTPGINMQTRTMFGGQTFSIRGYGMGGDATNFVGSGLKAYYNGIPVTDAEGNTRFDDIDFASLGRVDILRGPSSSLYGPGIGGVINLYTAEPHELGTTIRQETLGGQYGLLRSTTRLQNVSTAATTMLSYGHQAYDSYRVSSNSNRDFATLLGNFRPSDKQSISTFVSYAKLLELRAGELDSAQFAQKLNLGNDKYVGNRARQKMESFRAGVSHRYALGRGFENTTSAFFYGNTLEDVYAAGFNAKSAQSFGARTVFTTPVTAGTLALTGTSGAEYLQTNGLAQGYSMSKSVLGKLNSNFQTNTVQSNIFTQWEAALPQDFTLSAGASVNFVTYSIYDLYANTGNPTHKNASGRRVFDPVLTPRVAVRKMLTPNVSVYANVSQGFSPPTSSDAVIPYTGKTNDGLKPERGTQFEIGTKGTALNNRLTYEASLFQLRVTDKLSSESVDSAGVSLYSFTVNAGDQVDRGLELAASYDLVKEPHGWLSALRPFVSYTYSNFKYENFKSDANNNSKTIDYTGKKVVGVPPSVFNIGLDARVKSGGYMHVTLHQVDEMPISFDNAHKAVAYSLLGAKLGVQRDLGRGIGIDVFAGGDNLTNALYYTQVFVNHKFVVGQPPPNMYLPGPYKATYYGGINLTIRP